MANSTSELAQLGPGWFHEDAKQQNIHGEAFSLKVKDILYHQQSKFQDVLVFESETYGKVLVLDDILQCTEKDEFAYHEMMVHVPLCSHPCPKNVLVIGGGDGGILREIAKHPIVEKIHICEIDEDVISVSKKYLRTMSVGYDDPRVTVFVQDGVEFLTQAENQYDVIITDSSDPVGPAVVLYEQNYFQLLYRALRPAGITCLQGQCIWLSEDMEKIVKVMQICREIFAMTDYAGITDPSCTTGNIGMVIAGKDKDVNYRSPLKIISEEEADTLNLKYYDSEIHRAAFALPRFIKKALSLN